MKNTRTFLAAIAGWLVLGSVANAQTAASPVKENETLVLSPFVVNPSDDEGFIATSALAGGRLKVPLKDNAVAYSVITSEFIEALGIADINEASEWTVGMTQFQDNGADMVFAQHDKFTARGVTGVTLQRNFWPLNINFDSYNLDRFDFARGPNSILFGAGGISGAINSVTKRAKFDTKIAEVTVQTGSWSNNRVTADLNESNGPFALRVNLLWQDKGGWRDGDYGHKESVFVTGTYKLGKNTEIHFDAEIGSDEGRLPYTNIGDSISGWDGKTVFNTFQTSNLGTNNAAGINQMGAGSWLYSTAFGQDAIINFQNSGQTRSPSGAGTFVSGQPIVGGNINVGELLHQENVTASRYGVATANSKFVLPGDGFTHYFDNQPMNWQNYRDFAVYLNHNIGNFYFEAAVDSSREKRMGDTTYNRGMSTVRIDIDKQLPTGAPNPNFLTPYFQSSSQYQGFRAETALSARVAAAYLLHTDFGQFTFNALLGGQRMEIERAAYELVLPLNADPRRWALNNRIGFRQYWGQEDKAMPDLVRSVTVIDPVTNTTRDITPRWVVDTGRQDNTGVPNEDFDYLNLSMQAQLFKGRLNLIGAYRRDKYSNTQQQTRKAEDYPLDWDGYTPFYRPYASSNEYFFSLQPVAAKNADGSLSGGTISSEVRPRANDGFEPLHQYDGDVFKDDFSPPGVDGSVGTFNLGAVYNITSWLGLAANYSETFSPPATNLRFDGSLLPPTASTGKDFGVRLNLLEGKIFAALNYFESHQDGVGINPPNGLSGNINTIYNANAIGDASPGGRNIRNFAELPLIIRDSARDNTKGFEIEVTANLSNNWRILANYSTSTPLRDNEGPDSAAYYADHLNDFIQILADAGVTVNPATLVATAPATGGSIDAASAASAFNNIQNNYIKNITDAPKVITGSYKFTANAFVDYTFREGMLNGVRAGLGFNYRDKKVLGFRGGDTIPNPSNPAGAIDDPSVDGFSPVYSNDSLTFTGTLAYTWKLANNRSIAFNLRIDNLLNDTDPQYTNTQNRPPGGSLTTAARVLSYRQYSYKVPRSFTLSAKFKF